MSQFDLFVAFFERFLANIEHLKTENLTESDTRSKMIDSLLIEGLGWKEVNIRRESHVESGYLDYIIRLDNFQFVIEAKKNLRSFNLPLKGRRHKIRSLMRENSDVINQIRSYLLDKSLTHGVITNGEQFIIGKFVNTDGNDWQDNDAIIFQNIEKLNQNLTEFYNLISFEAIEQNGKIFIRPFTPFSKNLIDFLPNKNQEIYRNDFSSKLLLIIDRIFNEIGNNEDVEESRKMLEECYVPSIDIHKYSEELSGLFLDLPPTYDSDISKAKQTEHVSKNIKQQISSSVVPSPIVLIGGKGAGKTTFIRYFFNIVLNDKESRAIPSVYIDFRNYTAHQIDDTSAIYKKILDTLIKTHNYLRLSEINVLEQIFQTEINIKLRGVWSKLDSNSIEIRKSDYIEKLTENPIEYLTAISKYLQQFQRRRICLIIDNADQLDNDSQRKIFLLAQSLRGSLGAIVFVSLREGYFYRWKDKPPFDAFHSNVYHISAPPYSNILSKRIKYAIKQVKFETINSFVDSKKVEFEDKTLKDLFVNLYSTLFSQTSNSEIMKYLEQTSYPNIRRGLEEMNNFLISGHTKIDSYITSQPNIPIWEFFKSIGLNNKLYYSQNVSSVYNLFNPVHSASDHFIKIRILDFLYKYASSTGFKENFKDIKGVISVLSEISYSKECIIAELNSLLNNHLIVSSTFSSDVEALDTIAEEDEIRISNRGIYYITELVSRFHYLDLILQDTPIKSEDFFAEIQESFPKSDSSGNRNLQKRLKTTEIFIEYLIDQEHKGFVNNDLNTQMYFSLTSKTLKEKFKSQDKPRIEAALYGKQNLK